MNKIYKVVWNQNLGAFVAASEIAKGIGKSESKNSLKNHVFSYAVVAVATFGVQFDVQAQCTPVSPVVFANDSVVCAGTATGQLVIDAANVSVVNKGAYTISGASTGAIYARETSATGVNITNADTGTMTWDNALHGFAGAGSSFMVNAGFVSGNNFTKATVTNDGTMTVNATTSPGRNQSVGAIGVQVQNGTGLAVNNGTINVTSTAASADSRGSLFGMVVAAKDSVTINNASINITAIGTQAVSGISSSTTVAGGTVKIENNGDINVSSPVTTGLGAAGIRVFQPNASASKIEVINNGKITLGGASGVNNLRGAVFLTGVTGLATSFDVYNNAGASIETDSASASILLRGAHNDVNIVNAGDITGYIQTFDGRDTYTQTGGTLTGNINFGGGDNSVVVSGGSLTGNTVTGAGADSVTVSGGAMTGNIDLGGGDNSVVVSSGSLTGNTVTGAGADSVTVSGGAMTGSIDLGGGDNSVVVSGGSQAGNIVTGDGADSFTISGGTTNGQIFLGNGDNSVVVSGGVVGGNIKTGDGADSFTVSGGTVNGNIEAGAGADSVTVSAGAVTGVVDTGEGADVMNWNGGAIGEGVYMQTGEDTLTVSSSAYTGSEVLDGGEGTDNLTLSGVAVTVPGENLVNWEKINLESADITFSGSSLVTGKGGSLGLNIDAASRIALQPNAFTIDGDVKNAGLIDLASTTPGKALTITGNYDGSSAKMHLATVMGDDSSATDKLIVNGNVTGTTAITIQQVGGTGAQTINGIQLVQVDGSAPSSSFTVTNGPMQVGNFQYVLQQGSAIDSNDFYLVSTAVAQPPKQPEQPKQPEPSKPTAAVVYTPGPQVPIYRPAISAYSVARSMNADVAFMQTSTLHQRMGEQQVVDLKEGKAWARVIGQNLEGRGDERFNYEQKSGGIQLGHDVWSRAGSNGSVARVGGMFNYAESKTDAWDSIRPNAGLEEDTGKISTKAGGVGAYYTNMAQDGSYLDVVGQVNQLKNRFTDSYNMDATQKGFQINASVEGGLPLALVGRTGVLEGQGQLTLVRTQYSGFDDKFSNIAAEDFNAFRGRVGMRWHNGRAPKEDGRYYAIVNVVRDLDKTDKMTLTSKTDTQSLEVGEAFDQTYVELGVGAQRKLGKESWVYVDARYEHGLHNRKNTSKVNIGIKQSF